MSGDDWLRWINACLAGIVVFLLVAGSVARWGSMPRRFRRIAPWIIATYAIIAYGSGEIAASSTDVDPGLRVTMMLTVLAGLVGALLWGFGAHDYDE